MSSIKTIYRIVIIVFVLIVIRNGILIHIQNEEIFQNNIRVMKSANQCKNWIEHSNYLRRTFEHQLLYNQYLDNSGNLKPFYKLRRKQDNISYLHNIEKLKKLKYVFKTGLTKRDYIGYYTYYKSIDTNQIHFGEPLLYNASSGKILFKINGVDFSESRNAFYSIQKTADVNIEMLQIKMNNFQLDTLIIRKQISMLSF